MSQCNNALIGWTEWVEWIKKIKRAEKKVEWIKEIEELEKKEIICPLMIQEPGRFKPRLCVCDIPKTRAQFLMTEKLCHNSPLCLPRNFLLNEVREELYPRRPSYTSGSTHFNI